MVLANPTYTVIYGVYTYTVLANPIHMRLTKVHTEGGLRAQQTDVSHHTPHLCTRKTQVHTGGGLARSHDLPHLMCYINTGEHATHTPLFTCPTHTHTGGGLARSAAPDVLCKHTDSHATHPPTHPPVPVPNAITHWRWAYMICRT